MFRKANLLKASSLVMLCVISAAAKSADYSGGDGEPNNPYRIATPNDLNDIGNHVEDYNKCLVMTDDINLTEYTGEEFNIIGSGSSQFTPVYRRRF